ncbi:MAG: hypothetical protein L0154_00935 [Chloroflexi bacterium]|nr:hypothetical protein [Chloroflexota bacterium]
MKQLVFSIIILVLASVACGFGSGSDTNEATIPPLFPTATREILIVTSTPTVTAQVSATPQPTATQFRNTSSNNNSSNNTTPCYNATFVSDVTLPDGSFLTAGKTYVKTWRIRNSGSCSWGAGFQLEHTNRAGNAFYINDTGYINLPNTAPGSVVDISVNLTAKTGFASNQEYQANFRFRTSNGTYFGDTPFVKAYIVGEPNIAQFTVGQSSVTATSLRNGSARIPVTWQVNSRPLNTNLVFEQVMPDNTIRNIELPRSNPIVSSSGSGTVAPTLPTNVSPITITLRLRLVDLSTNATLKQFDVTLTVTYENSDNDDDGDGNHNPDGSVGDGSTENVTSGS